MGESFQTMKIHRRNYEFIVEAAKVNKRGLAQQFAVIMEEYMALKNIQPNLTPPMMTLRAAKKARNALSKST